MCVRKREGYWSLILERAQESEFRSSLVEPTKLHLLFWSVQITDWTKIDTVANYLHEGSDYLSYDNWFTIFFLSNVFRNQKNVS